MVKKSKSNSPQHSHYIAIVAVVAVVAVVILVMNSMKTSTPVEDTVMEEGVMEEGALVGEAKGMKRGLIQVSPATQKQKTYKQSSNFESTTEEVYCPLISVSSLNWGFSAVELYNGKFWHHDMAADIQATLVECKNDMISCQYKNDEKYLWKRISSDCKNAEKTIVGKGCICDKTDVLYCDDNELKQMGPIDLSDDNPCAKRALEAGLSGWSKPTALMLIPLHGIICTYVYKGVPMVLDSVSIVEPSIEDNIWFGEESNGKLTFSNNWANSCQNSLQGAKNCIDSDPESFNLYKVQCDGTI